MLHSKFYLWGQLKVTKGQLKVRDMIFLSMELKTGVPKDLHVIKKNEFRDTLFIQMEMKVMYFHVIQH